MSQGNHPKEPWWLIRFSQSSIPAKGLFLVLVPVFVQILFLAVFWLIQVKVDDDRERSFHSKRVLFLSYNTLSDFSIGFNRALLFVLGRDSTTAESIEERLSAVDEDLSKLTTEVADNERQSTSVKDFVVRFKEFRELARRIVQASIALPAPGSDDRAPQVESLSELLLQASEKSNSLRSKLDEFIDAEKTLDDRRQKSFQRSLQSLFWLFVGGALTMIGGAWTLHKFFSEAFSKRVDSIIRNVKEVSIGNDLSKTLAGSDEIAEIDRAIHALSQTLREKDAETELFVYSVSHDLRSPLVNLHGFSEELGLAVAELQGYLTDSEQKTIPYKQIQRLIDKDLKESLRYIKSAVERMASIIDSLLRLSRAGRNELKIERVELKTSIARITESLSGTIAERNATVSVGALPPIKGDKSSVEQIFQNLLQNALKYSDPNRPPVIEIGELSQTRTFVTIFVKDNGLGIPESSLPKLFVAFRRFHPNVAPGEGIGLAITRQMVLRHKGQIWCDSKAGSGSTFYVSLPLCTES